MLLPEIRNRQAAFDLLSDNGNRAIVDPATGRRVLCCTGCADLVFLPAVPCVVSTACPKCWEACYLCSVSLVNANVTPCTADKAIHDKHGRGVCEWCAGRYQIEYAEPFASSLAE